MSSKQISNVLIVVCLIGMVAWWRWQSKPLPQKKPATLQVHALQPPRMSPPSADASGDDGSGMTDATKVDPAMLQALAQAMAQQQQMATDRAVVNNLRQLASAADQYFTEYGLSSVAYSDLVGTNSTQAVKPFNPVAGETYPDVIVAGSAISASGVAGARTMTYQ